MATSATELLSLADAKTQLQILDNDRDAEITAAISRAVGHVAAGTGLPLIDRTETFRLERPAVHDPLILPSRFVREVGSGDPAALQYWTKDAELRSEPDGAIETSTLGRLTTLKSDGVTELWPPAAGWPEALYGSRLIVPAKLGTTIADGSVVHQAIILATRGFVEQPDRIQEMTALTTLINLEAVTPV